jgi:hypothetical protein
MCELTCRVRGCRNLGLCSAVATCTVLCVSAIAALHFTIPWRSWFSRIGPKSRLCHKCKEDSVSWIHRLAEAARAESAVEEEAVARALITRWGLFELLNDIIDEQPRLYGDVPS